MRDEECKPQRSDDDRGQRGEESQAAPAVSQLQEAPQCPGYRDAQQRPARIRQHDLPDGCARDKEERTVAPESVHTPIFLGGTPFPCRQDRERSGDGEERGVPVDIARQPEKEPVQPVILDESERDVDQPEERPSEPVKVRIQQIEPPKYESGFERFNFEEGLWNG